MTGISIREAGVCLLALSLAAAAAGAGPALYDFGNPSCQEEWMRQCIQRARGDPEAEADAFGLDNTHAHDVPDGSYDVGEGITNAGVADQRDYWSRYQGPRQVLAWSAALNAAARNHSDDMHTYNNFSHYTTESDHGYVAGDGPGDRAYAEGYANHFVSENVAVGTPAGYYTAADMHQGLFEDYTVSTRGHRKNILGSCDREIGVGYVSRSPNAGGWTDFWTIDFATDAFASTHPDDPSPPPETVFVTGVVFDDANDNGSYEPGEAAPGVRVFVRASGAGWLKHYAITAAGGGYTVPLLDAAGADLPAGTQLDVTFYDPSRGQSLTASATILAGTVTFEEDPDPPDQEYQRLNVGLDALAADFSPAPKGDANFDGKVDVIDLTILANNFSQTGREWIHADFDNNGLTDVLDLTAFANNFGWTAGGGPPGGEGQGRLPDPVPAPAAWALLSAGAAAVLRRRPA